MKYTKKEDGRYKFQIDLALYLINKGIELAWPDPSDASQKPKWIRQKGLVPCDCKRCFFCLNGMTTGMIHKPVKRVVPKAVPRGHAKKREPVAKKRRNCQRCYERLSLLHPVLGSAEKRQLRKKTTRGCRA